MARRRAIDRVRRRLTYAKVQERFASQQPVEEQSVESNHDGLGAETLARLFATLPSAQKEAIELTYFHGLSQRDTAVRTGVPLGTIKTRLELALKKLRSALEKLGRKEDWVAC